MSILRTISLLIIPHRRRACLHHTAIAHRAQILCLYNLLRISPLELERACLDITHHDHKRRDTNDHALAQSLEGLSLTSSQIPQRLNNSDHGAPE